MSLPDLLAEMGYMIAELFTPAPAQAHSDTSVAAAEAIEPNRMNLRTKVLQFIQSRGTEGATDQEIQAALGMDPSTERPRRVELQRLNLVKDSGQRRKTASGRSATVWVYSSAGE